MKISMQNMRGTAANCDRYFELPAGSFSFDDRLAGELSRLTDIQLMDTKVWRLFVDLFRHPGVDDANSGWRCEYWGKMMRGACFTYRVTGDEALYGERRRCDGRDAHRVQCGLRQGERAYQPLVPRQRPDRSGQVIRAGVSESGAMVREGCGPQKPRLSLFW